jgi:pyrrolysine biosynthesis protein PylD
MTRLKSNDIKDISTQLQQYDEELLRKTNRTLRGIACHAAGVREEEILPVLSSMQAAVVPITSGEGVITGFSASVSAILTHTGIRAFVTGHSDVAGITEAFARGAGLLFMADDHRFTVFSLKSRTVVDNGAATGKGFAAGLDLLSGGVAGRNVLVLGCGPVGYAAVEWLVRSGAEAAVYDIEPGFSREVMEKIKRQLKIHIKIEQDLKQALSAYRLIIDATNAENIIPVEFITPQTFIAAPGMPIGLTPTAVKKTPDRLLHDPLQIGVATMAIAAISG